MREPYMEDSSVIDLARHRNARSPEKKWSFIQGFMVGIAPVMIWTPIWVVPATGSQTSTKVYPPN
jgi:hypothetical protein